MLPAFLPITPIPICSFLQVVFARQRRILENSAGFVSMSHRQFAESTTFGEDGIYLSPCDGRTLNFSGKVASKWTVTDDRVWSRATIAFTHVSHHAKLEQQAERFAWSFQRFTGTRQRLSSAATSYRLKLACVSRMCAMGENGFFQHRCLEIAYACF